MPGFRVEIGPERMVLADGLQPFILRARDKTIVVQAQLQLPPHTKTARDIFPAVPGTVISRDCGKSWKRWIPEPAHGMGPFFEGSATQLSDGTIILLEWVASGPSTEGLYTGKLWKSNDDFETLKGPFPAIFQLPQGRGDGCDDSGNPCSGFILHRTLLETQTSELIATVYCWFKEDASRCPYMPTMFKFRCILVRSCDRGSTWEYVSTIAVGPEYGEEGFNEPVMVRISTGPKKGRFVCLMRTGKCDHHIFEAHSDDSGITWSAPQMMPFMGVDPDLIEMADGTLVCSFGRRTAAAHLQDKEDPAHGNYIVLSKDSGGTWSEPIHIPIDPYSGTKMTTCYTSIAEIEPGVLIMFYDIGRWGSPIRYIASRTIKISQNG